MNRVSPFTLSFLQRRPGAAAAVLAGMDAADAAIFLESVPTRTSRLAIAHMDAWPASLILAQLDDEIAAPILSEMEYLSTAVILRLMPDGRRDGILDQLPAPLKRDLEASLTFPRDTVGAWTTTSIAAMDGKKLVSDAIDQLRQSSGTAAECIFVVDEQRRLRGVVSAATLLKGAPTMRLDGIMDSAVPPLPARTRINAVLSPDTWDNHVVLPVVSRQKQLIGALSREAAFGLSQAIVNRHASAGSTSIATSMGDAFATCAIGLAQLIADDATSIPIGTRDKTPS